MAGLGGLQCNFRRLEIPDFTYQYDVWILPQNRSQPRRKGYARLRVYLNLVDSGKQVFNWILDRNDVLGRGFEPIEGGVKGRGLSTAGRPGHEDHSLWAPQNTFERPKVFDSKIQALHRHFGFAAVEDADHNFFAEV